MFDYYRLGNGHLHKNELTHANDVVCLMALAIGHLGATEGCLSSSYGLSLLYVCLFFSWRTMFALICFFVVNNH